MWQPGFATMTYATLAVTLGVSGKAAQEPPTDLPRLVAGLDLTEAGARRWLAQLVIDGDNASLERLLAVTDTGAPLVRREGGKSSVRIDRKLDTLLLRHDMAIVLVHNHPANSGLSRNDLWQLTKPGVAAIIAIGHEGSVFVASAGPRLDRDFFEESQYQVAKTELVKRLRAEWPSGRLSAAVSDAHLSHLVTRVLEKAGIVRYWFKLRGAGRESYERARVIFGQVVESAAVRLKKGE